MWIRNDSDPATILYRILTRILPTLFKLIWKLPKKIPNPTGSATRVYKLTQALDNVVVHDAALAVEVAPLEQLDETLLVAQLEGWSEDVAVIHHLNLRIAAYTTTEKSKVKLLVAQLEGRSEDVAVIHHLNLRIAAFTKTDHFHDRPHHSGSGRPEPGIQGYGSGSAFGMRIPQ